MVAWLLANGAEVELEGQGEPTLLNAATSGNPAIVAMLIAAGADVAIVNDVQQTALHVAVESDERLLVTELLLDAGADLNALHWGDTPLDVAIDNRALQTAALLRSRGAVSVKHAS